MSEPCFGSYLREKHPEVRVFHEDRVDIPDGVEIWHPGSCIYQFCRGGLLTLISVEPGAEKIDLIVTLGGDGTILHASSLFKSGAVPPVLSFSLGTLGFLLPFRKYPFPRYQCQALRILPY